MMVSTKMEEEEDRLEDVNTAMEELASQSGYLADCDSVHQSMDSYSSNNSSPTHPHDQEMTAESRFCLPSQMQVILPNKRKHSTSCRKHHHYQNQHQQQQQLQGRLHLPSSSGRLRRHHTRKIDEADQHHSRWIERIYSNTPFAAPADDYVNILYPSAAPLPSSSKISTTNALLGSSLPSCIRWNTAGISFQNKGRSMTNPKDIGPSTAAAVAVAPPLPKLLSRRYPRHRRRSTGGWSAIEQENNIAGINESFLEGLTADNVDDEILASTLLDVVQGLLLDSYAVQATYRSYYCNNTNMNDNDVVT
jgi:hypothetical protein